MIMPTEAFAISSPNQPISMHFVEHKRAVRCKSVRREFFGEVPREEVQPPILLAVEEAPVVQQERIEKQAAIPSCKNKSKKTRFLEEKVLPKPRAANEPQPWV